MRLDLDTLSSLRTTLAVRTMAPASAPGLTMDDKLVTDRATLVNDPG